MYKKLFGLAIIITLSLSVFGQTNLKSSQNITISDGLSHNGVTCLLEDSKGYLWVGTYDGLNRYDGYEIKTFKNTIDYELLASNRVRTLTEDTKGNLWIGTDDGISVYDYAKEQFKKIFSDKIVNNGITGPIIRKILIDKKRKEIVCASEGEGILLFSSNYKFLHQYIPQKDPSNSPVLFFDGIALDDDNYLFSCSSGLWLFNMESHQFKNVLADKISSSNSISTIDRHSLLATISNGIAVIDYEPHLGSYSFSLRHKKLQSYQFKTAAIDKLGKLWLGTISDGIIYIDNITAIKNNTPFKLSSYTSKSDLLRMSCFLPTATHGCWVGTFNKGLYRFDLKENPFKYYNTEMGSQYRLRSNSITHISAIDSNRALITANRGGIALFDTKSQAFSPLPFTIPTSLSSKIGTVFIDSKKNIWLKVVNEKDLYRIKANTKTLEKVAYKGLPVFDDAIPQSIDEDRYGNIWVGDHLSGVYKIILNKAGNIVNIEELNKHPFFNKKKLSLVRFVYADPLYNYIWVGSEDDGLLRINIQNNKPLKEDQIEQYITNKKDKNALSSNSVSTIIRLPNQELWIGTERGGICKVIHSNTQPLFTTFGEKQGLSNNVVKSILYDKDNNLWVATNIGLNKFNTKTFKFRNFSKTDGLPFEDFWYTSAKLDNGIYLFSGVDGFCYFNPNDITDQETLPALEFGDLKILNKTILPGDTVNNRVVLEHRMVDHDKIDLKYNEDVFSIGLNSLHFSNPRNHYLRYKLLPVNKDWIQTSSSQRFINYSGLKPGDYVLQVAASNSLNQWTKTKELKITISPPFWRTTMAYILYYLLIAVIIYIVIYFILKIQSLRHNIQLEQLEKDTQKRINAAKLRFFSNISHEIKTPITLISGPVDLLLKQFKNNFKVQDELHLIQRQSKKISQLIDQVHDFQRGDANLLRMNYTTFCFDTFIHDLIADYEFMAKNTDKKMDIIGGEFKIYVSADKDKLEKIMDNLLSNAFRHTKANDSIQIKYERRNEHLIISVSDSGRGIHQDDLPHIFERFYQSRQKNNIYPGGSGIGLAFTQLLVEMHYGYIDAESELSHGTTINLRLPIITEEVPDSQKETEELILSAEERQAPIINNAEDYSLKSIRTSGEFAESTIFLAEDNDEMRKFISEILANFFKVKTFTNGQECLDKLQEEWPDIIISDVLMPELNGFDLCKNVKSDIKTSHIPVILLTVCISTEEQITGLNNGADAYINKPFDIQQLITSTESVLKNRQQLRERYQLGLPLKLDNENANDNAFLEKLYSLMDKNIDNDDLDFNNFARELYLNRTHFYQKVKALTNQTPFKLLTLYRLKKAAQLLLQNKYSVNEVYMMTGFKSRTHFSKLFKETYGVSPGKYTETKL